MRSLMDVMFAAWFAAGSLVAASPVAVGRRTSLTQIANPDYEFNPALSVYKTHLKYGWPVPDYLKEAVAKSMPTLVTRGGNGSVVATPITANDKAYVVPVKIGTPPQTLLLDLDTGSSDLWVFSSETPKSMVRGQSFYTPKSSTTAKNMSGASWVISYGDGSSCSGVVVNDKVSVGDLIVENQAVESARRVSSSFTADPMIHGLLGLGFSSLNTVTPTKQKTFFDNVKSGLDQPVFTCDLRRKANGTYDFGYIDKSKYTGNISWTPVTQSRGFWSFAGTGYAVGSNNFTAGSISGIADTGTTLLYLPTTIVRDYYSKVTGATNNQAYGGYTFPCSATLPSFTFGVGDGHITIPSSILNLSPVTRGSTTCFGGIQPSSRVGVNIFGDVALKAAFVIFEGGSTPRIGWASKPTA